MYILGTKLGPKATPILQIIQLKLIIVFGLSKAYNQSRAALCKAFGRIDTIKLGIRVNIVETTLIYE
jgi:hypothetical protein